MQRVMDSVNKENESIYKSVFNAIQQPHDENKSIFKKRDDLVDAADLGRRHQAVGHAECIRQAQGSAQ